jgi:hypothetical protein
MLRRSLPILTVPRASVDHSAKGFRTLGSLLGMSQRSELGRSYENRSAFDRLRRINETGSTRKTLTWKFSIDEGESHIRVRSSIVAQPVRRQRHGVTDDWPSTSSHGWRSPMLHILMLATMVGFFGLCVNYSYPLTGTVFLGTIVCYALARSRRF